MTCVALKQLSLISSLMAGINAGVKIELLSKSWECGKLANIAILYAIIDRSSV